MIILCRSVTRRQRRFAKKSLRRVVRSDWIPISTSSIEQPSKGCIRYRKGTFLWVFSSSFNSAVSAPWLLFCCNSSCQIGRGEPWECRRFFINCHHLSWNGAHKTWPSPNSFQGFHNETQNNLRVQVMLGITIIYSSCLLYVPLPMLALAQVAHKSGRGSSTVGNSLVYHHVGNQGNGGEWHWHWSGGAVHRVLIGNGSSAFHKLPACTKALCWEGLQPGKEGEVMVTMTVIFS